jgi:integrase/recombinase XerD
MKAYLEPEDIELMERGTSCIRDRLLVRLLFRLGCRISELLAIKVGDIDFERATVTILHLKTRNRLSCPKCEAGLARRHQFCPQCGQKVDEVVKRQQERRRIRVLPIDRKTLEMLRNYITDKVLDGGSGSALLFNLNRHRSWQIVRNCARHANLPDLINPETGRVRGVSPHRLRDAFSVHAMKLNDSGDALRLLQEHLGHTGLNTTAKYRKVCWRRASPMV